MSIQDKFNLELLNIPAPGNGCHPALLKVANYGILAKIEPAQLHQLIRQSIPEGGRQVPDKEIQDAIRKAQTDIKPDASGQYRYAVATRPKPVILPRMAQALIDRAAGITELDLWEASPVRLTDDPVDDWKLIVAYMFEPFDYIFTGSKFDTAVYRACDVLMRDEPTELIGLNPFNEGGKRQDADVKAYRYCLAEFDELSIDDQIRFWAAVPLPVAALIFSGNKSIHCWIKIDGVSDLGGWEKTVKNALYQQRLKPLGLDTACSNTSRMSRMPSFRRDNGNMQKLLYLDPSPKNEPIIKNL
jgi:hypothetical protein